MSTTTTHIESEKLHSERSRSKLVPALRFREFHGEWNKEILQGTCKKPISYGIVQTGEDQIGGIPCVRVIDLTNKVTKRSDMICTTQKISESYSKTILEENELMLALRGEIGLVKMVTKELVGANLTRGVARLSTYENKYSSSFIMWLLQNENVIKDISKRVNGSALKEIPLSGLRKVKLTYPTLPEQQKIASFLSAVDEKIQQLTKKKELLEQYKKGVMQQLFSGELRFKPDLVAEPGRSYPDWEEKRLGDFCTIRAGGDVGKLNFSKIKTDVHRFPVYANALTNDGIYGYSDAYSVHEESVTVTGRGDVGHASARKGGYTAVVRLLVLIPKIKTSTYFLKTVINYINVFVESTGVPQLTSPQLSIYRVALPCFEEQQKIASYLSSIDTKITQVAELVEATQTFKKGLLQQMFV